jgi:hypothetical protein
MIEANTNPESLAEKKEAGTGCLGELGWFLSGAILPMGSFSFYRRAARRAVGSAILFFVVFTVIISTIATISVGVSMFSLVSGIQQAYDDGDIPEITISHGVAQVDGPQPFILFDETGASGERIFLGADTTGEITEIDTSRYDQGFLITRTELHVLNQQQNDYQVLPLSELHTLFSMDPIIINAHTMSQAWQVMSTIIVVAAFIFLVLWHTVLRLMILLVIGLVAWGIVSLIKPNTGFSPILITGLYAIVPAVYLSHLFSRAGVGFPGLQTFFLICFWAMGLIVNFADVKFLKEDRPLRLWTALIGVPLLLLYAGDMLWQIPSPAGPIALWITTLLTSVVLIGLRLYFRFKDQRPEQAVAESPTPGVDQ